MRCIFALVFTLMFSGKSLADETVTIFVKETSYLVDSQDAELSHAELESTLKQLKFSLVTLDVDYCARPDALAYAYVAIANADHAVKGINLRASGSSETRKCKKFNQLPQTAAIHHVTP